MVTGQVVGTGNAQLRIVSGRASLVVHHFAQPPAGKIYQVWLVHGKNAPSPTMALFSPTSAGNAVEEVPGNLQGRLLGAGDARAHGRQPAPHPRAGHQRPAGLIRSGSPPV